MPKKGFLKVVLGSSSISKDAFNTVGLNISLKAYMRIRYATGIVLVVLSVISFLQEMQLDKFALKMLILLILYIITFPTEKLNGMNTPFNMMLQKLRKNYLDKKDEELMMIITQFKNLIVAGREKPVSADQIMMTLMRFSEVTRPAFLEAMKLMMLGKVPEAKTAFQNAIGTKLGKDFASVLFKLDELNPAEFKGQIEVLQKSLKEQKKTKSLRVQERNSNIIVAGATIQNLIIVMNFIVMVMYFAMQGI